MTDTRADRLAALHAEALTSRFDALVQMVNAVVIRAFSPAEPSPRVGDIVEMPQGPGRIIALGCAAGFRTASPFDITYTIKGLDGSRIGCFTRDGFIFRPTAEAK